MGNVFDKDNSNETKPLRTKSTGPVKTVQFEKSVKSEKSPGTFCSYWNCASLEVKNVFPPLKHSGGNVEMCSKCSDMPHPPCSYPLTPACVECEKHYCIIHMIRYNPYICLKCISNRYRNTGVYDSNEINKK
jgi:hypothetical protein